MADTKVSALTELAAEPDAADKFVLVDVSDTSMAASGTDKWLRYDRFSVAQATRVGSVYRTLFRTGTRLTTAAASGTKYLLAPNLADTSAAGITANQAGMNMIFNLVAADLAITGLTTKLRVEASVSGAGTAPAVTITTGLYPVTISANSYVLGTVVANSGAALASPPSGITSANSGDFDLPTDGAYMLGVIVSGTPAAAFPVHGTLQARNV